MIEWIKIFKHILPTGKACRLTIEKILKDFFIGLTDLPGDVKIFYDNIFDDVDPQKTRQLPLYENQFALRSTGLSEQGRRDRLDGTWKALGGQDPYYIQDTLRNAGFDVYVHEYWEPIPGRPGGGSINGDVVPVVRNPFLYLNDGNSAFPWLTYDGGSDSQDGDELAQDGSINGATGYPLVNKVFISSDLILGDGSDEMQDGGVFAQERSSTTTRGFKQYLMPIDTETFPYYLYIGGETFPDLGSVQFSRKEEFEDLCLKICPLEQWIGILVSYS